jgi:hypothetical protein
MRMYSACTEVLNCTSIAKLTIGQYACYSKLDAGGEIVRRNPLMEATGNRMRWVFFFEREREQDKLYRQSNSSCAVVRV